MQTKELQLKRALRNALFVLLICLVGMTKMKAQQPRQIKVSEINLSNIGTIEERVFMVHSILDKGYFCYKNLNLSNTIDIYVSNDASDEMSDFDFFYDNLLYDQLNEFSSLDKNMRGELFVQWRQGIDNEVFRTLYEDFTRGIASVNSTCETALPFTANGAFSFSAGVNSGSPCGDVNNAQCSDPYYCSGSHQGQDNCLSTAPNPAFYYIRITTPGDLNIYLESTPSLDIDFDCWGPFDDVATACEQLSCSNIVDCSYSSAHVENCHINNAQTDEYYILLITNFSNQPCEISFENTGTGSGGDFLIEATASPEEGGIVSGTGFYNNGAVCTLSATANPGYAFVNWTENGTVVSTNSTYTFSVLSNRTLLANFQHIYTINVTANPTAGGMVTGGGIYVQGSSCTLTATPNEGYTFVNWTENGTEVSTDTTYSFTVTGDRTLVANFVISGNVEHEYVDLGLPSGTLWATCNVGADTPEEYGNYFSWGETQTKSAYYWSNYQHCFGNSNQLTKYCPNPSFGYNGFSDTLIILLPEDDAATVNWGNDWRIPTQEEWQELGDNTIHTWTIQNGVSGCLFTATNGNSLFIPAAGMYTENNFIQANSVGHYWSSSLTTDYLYPYDANNLLFSSDRFEISGNFRYRGFSVRPIRSASQVLSYVINATASPIEGGIVTGAGTYNHGTTCTLTASANEGYIFVKWTENGTEVSTDATYSFTVTGDRTLAANFTENANQENITFADANVKAICVANWDTNGDGELSYAEAAAVTDLGSVFSNNYSITSFDELQYFTGLTSVSSFTHCTHLAFVTLPNTITSIGYSAFFNCWALESITIPSSVTSIGYEAFSWCTSLNQIIVDSGNVFFDSRENCNAIIETSTNKLIFGCMNTVIPSSVTILRGDSFRGCSGLTSFTLPSTIDSIISNPFTACHNLEQIIVEETNPMFDSRDNCNAIIKTNSNILVSGCKNTVIPDAIVSIGDKAFKWCRYLTSIVIPQNVTSIGLSAFFDCWLSSMTVYAETPPTLAFESFGGGLNKSIPVYVPCGSVEAYQSAAYWSQFTNIQEMHCPAEVHFITSGVWNEPSNWSEGALPSANDMVFIDAPCQLDTDAEVADLTISDGQSLTILSGKTLAVNGALTNISATGLVIEDSAQLIHNNTGVQATVKETIAGYGTSEDKWYFIASPITDSIIPSADNGLLLGNYDLYYCYPTSSDRLEWRNYKSDAFALHNGKGYLYANETGTELSFGGTLAPSHSSVMRTVYYEENNNSPGNGWTFLGNPFACNCYLVDANGNPLTIYKMNTDGAGLVEVLSGPIAPFEGFFYYTTETHDVYFSRTVPTGLSK